LRKEIPKEEQLRKTAIDLVISLNLIRRSVSPGKKVDLTKSLTKLLEGEKEEAT